MSHDPPSKPGDATRAPTSLVERQHDASEYVAEIAEQLAGMARDVKLDVLSYLLEMARLEAQTVAARVTARKAS